MLLLVRFQPVASALRVLGMVWGLAGLHRLVRWLLPVLGMFWGLAGPPTRLIGWLLPVLGIHCWGGGSTYLGLQHSWFGVLVSCSRTSLTQESFAHSSADPNRSRADLLAAGIITLVISRPAGCFAGQSAQWICSFGPVQLFTQLGHLIQWYRHMHAQASHIVDTEVGKAVRIRAGLQAS